MSRSDEPNLSPEPSEGPSQPSNGLRSLYLRLLRLRYRRTMRLFEEHLDWKLTGKWVLISAGAGILGALGAIIFSTLVGLGTRLALVDLAGYNLPGPGGEAGGSFDFVSTLLVSRRWLLLVIPALGGLLSGWIVYTFAPEAEGHGTDAVIDAFHRKQGVIRPRVAFVKTVASAITIGSGGSAGQEGPIAQIGAALSSSIGKLFGMTSGERRMLLIAGMAAGIGSIFRSPLGGAFFAVEVLYREDIESDGIMPAVVAAITGYSVYSLIVGSSTVFAIPPLNELSPFELPPLVILALLCAAMGILFTRTFYGTKTQIFGRLDVPPQVKPAVGGLVVGAIAFFFPAVLGSSYGWLQQAINGNLPLTFMVALAIGKIVATSFTIGSGGSGGVFAPSLVIGGMIGGAFGFGLDRLFPELVTQPGAYVMLGMGTFFSAAANVPIATTIMISEMTGSYKLLVPLIFAAVIAHLLARRWSLYQKQVKNYSESPAHRVEWLDEVASTRTVASIVEYPVYYHSLSPSNTLDEVISVFTRTREVVLPIIDPMSEAEGESPRYLGMVVFDAIQPLLRDQDREGIPIVAQDLAVPFVSVKLSDPLKKVLEEFDRVQYPELPVVDNDGLIVAFARPERVLREYHRDLLRHQQGKA